MQDGEQAVVAARARLDDRDAGGGVGDEDVQQAVPAGAVSRRKASQSWVQATRERLATEQAERDAQAEREREPFGAVPEDADRTVTSADPGADDSYGCTATGPRWRVADLPKAGEAYTTPARARAVALDLMGSKWVAECDRHGRVSMGLNKFGDAVADVAAAYVYVYVYVYDSEQDAADAARTHLDAHAREDADVMTPEDIDAAHAPDFSRDRWRALGWALGWMSDGRVRGTADGFTAYDISPDRADVS